MPSDSLLPAPPTVKDAPLQVALREQLMALNRQLAEQFQSPPTFHSFVQHAFEQAFPTLTPSLDVHHGFIRLPETTLPPTTSEAQPSTDAELLPTLFDAVVQRIVANQPSTYASRMASLHRLPATGEALLPLSGITPAGLDKFLDRLAGGLGTDYSAFVQAYWARARSLTDARTQKQWCVQTRIELLKAEVALLAADRLLSPADLDLFALVLRLPDAQARQALRTDRPCVYGVALKGVTGAADLTLRGAFVLTSRDPEHAVVRAVGEVKPVRVRPVEPSMNVGTVLLFLPDSGLEAFDSLASLDRELHRRLNHPVEFAAVLDGLAAADQARGLALHRQMKSTGQVVYHEQLDSPFDESVESQCRLMLDNFTSTLTRYQSLGEHTEMSELPQVLDRVTDPGRLFSARGVLWGREIKRGQAHIRTFLHDASPADKDAWRVAMADYWDLLSSLPDAEGLPSLAQFSDKSALLAYANAQLRIRLKADYALDIDPDDVLVHTKEPYIPSTIVVPGAPAPAPREPGTPLFQQRSRTLTALSLENVGGLDFNFTHFSRLSENTRKKPDEALLPEDLEPAPAYDGLTLQQVKDLVRTVNVGQGCESFLKDRLMTSPSALAQKHTYGQVMLRQLRLDAIEAKINGDFLPDRLARALHLPMQRQASRLVRRGQTIEHCGKFDGVVQAPVQLPIQAGQGVKCLKAGVREKQQHRADVHARLDRPHPDRFDLPHRPHHGVFRVPGRQHKSPAQGQIRSAGYPLEGNPIDTRPVSTQCLSCLGVRETQHQGEQVQVGGAEQAVSREQRHFGFQQFDTGLHTPLFLRARIGQAARARPVGLHKGAVVSDQPTGQAVEELIQPGRGDAAQGQQCFASRR